MTTRTVAQIKADIADVKANAPDCCMCGSSVNHSPWEGHTPISMLDYFLGKLEEELQQAEAEEL